VSTASSEGALNPAGERRVATAIGLGVVHVGALAVFIPGTFTWPAVIAGIVLYYLTGSFGICLGYHRLLTHRSMKLAKPLEYAVAILGVLALQGGPITWIATHRAHHAFSDTERDPHNSGRGFLWSHVGWLFRRNPARLSLEAEHRYAADLYADPIYRFLEATYVWWQVGLGVALLAIGGWSWVVWGVFVRLVCLYHATWLVNSASHLSGYRTYRAPGGDHSTNNWWVALIAWGEGWHNNHHAFPFSARHGLRWFEFDATWWAIRVLSFCGLATEIKVPAAEMLARRVLRTRLRPKPVRAR
jgi:stearoyl-CoA desaturase (delta-9 desaturase)